MACVSGEAHTRGTQTHISSQSHRNGGGCGTCPLGRRVLRAGGPGRSRAQSDRARGQCRNQQRGLRRLGLGVQGRHHHQRPGGPSRTSARAQALCWPATPPSHLPTMDRQNATIFTGGGSKDPNDLNRGPGRTRPAGCRTRTTCSTASPPATRSRRADDLSRRRTAAPDLRGAVLRLRPLRQQRRRPAGLLVLPEHDRARHGQRGGGTASPASQDRRPAHHQRLQQRRHDVDDHRLHLGPAPTHAAPASCS